MSISKFHANQLTLRRQRLRMVVRLADALSALAIGYLWLSVGDYALHSSLGFWLVAALLGWHLSRGQQYRIPLQPYAQGVLAPLYAGVIFTLLLGVLNQAVGWWLLLSITLSWMAAMLMARLFFRRQSPAFVLGVMPGTDISRIEAAKVSFFAVKSPEESLENFEGLVFNFACPPQGAWLDFYLHAQTMGVPTWHISALEEEINGQVTSHYLRTAHMRREQFVTTYARLKRVLDIAAVLVCAVPLLLVSGLVALVVLVDSGRPVLFWQTRVGQDGRSFKMVKFRTMRTDSEKQGAAFAQTSDQRITRIGHILRKFRLDELPQFWNVLKGDMSIIGPRPEQQTFVERFNQELHLYPVRHWVKPGITGWAQVMHGYAADADETVVKLRHDIYYIKHFSLWLDIRIVAKTVWTMLTGFGAR